MNIIVCLKQVPLTEDISFDEKGNMIRENLKSGINPADDYALEQALILKDKFPDTKILALTMGPKQAEDISKYAISKGADDAFLINDNSLKGSDALITAMVLSKAIKKIKSEFLKYDLIFCGDRSLDGETAHVPAQISIFEDIPDILFAKKIIGFENSRIIVEKELNDEVLNIAADMPCLVSFELNPEISCRLPSIKNKIKSKSFNVKKLNIYDIGLKPQEVGETASPTWVGKCFENKYASRDKDTRDINLEELASIIKKHI
jgi:electron transfer flavoprotein beta subunit